MQPLVKKSGGSRLHGARRVGVAAVFALGAACGAGGAGPVDASVPAQDVDERPQGCGEVPRGFTCEGATLRHCEDEVAARLDCARYTADAGACGAISPRYGSYCVSPAAAPCRMAVPHGSHDHVYFAHCAGEGAGCVVRAAADYAYESACTPGLGACDPAAPPRCLGDRLVTRCERGQPVAYDCASYGGTCDASQLACVGVREGVRCGASFTCAAGLTCRAVTGRRGVNACQR